ncbi:DUF3943 domain-containing protein [uncultured Shewanella sp.]|uniref:DUF3943 domain-containing protein n=1 Tax=uncultured Shewanella sp. TaxID=173975 RepID=UPI00261C4805|nr:DUF3943 domain-containing protein [uncultured Shewanella sp.]
MKYYSVPFYRTACFAAALSACSGLVYATDKSDETAEIYRPSITNSSWEDTVRSPSVYEQPYKVSLFSAEHGEDSDRLWSQTKSVAAYGVAFAGFLALLPSSITNWDKSGEKLHKKWWDNVSSGPVWDRDNFTINYIGHPYFGGVYYQSARKSGYRQWDAFMYSFMMSTFYWEYGVEAFAEVPSIQDLVVTPVLGWVYGEWAFNKEREIRQRGGTVWGSEAWGDTALFFLDPIDSLGRGVNILFDDDIVKAGTGYLSMREVPLDNGQIDKQLQFQVQYAIGAGEATEGVSRHSKASDKASSAEDPVDYSIVGLSIGSSYMSPTEEWGLESGWAPSASVGLYFTRSFSTRLSYARGKLTDKRTGESTTFENYSFDGQYYLNGQNRLRPFLTFGLGESLIELDREKKTFQVNGGAGLHYRLTPNWALQLDWRYFYSAKLSSGDQLTVGQLVYRFGSGESWL